VESSGEAITRPSIAPSEATASPSVVAFPPTSSHSDCAAASRTSAIATISTPGIAANVRAWNDPIPPAPTIANLIREHLTDLLRFELGRRMRDDRRMSLTSSYAVGPDQPELRDLTLGGVLAWAATTTPDRVALIAGVADPSARRQWTYAELYSESMRTAHALLRRFEPGERVGEVAEHLEHHDGVALHSLPRAGHR
jgi:hypothetical protein